MDRAVQIPTEHVWFWHVDLWRCFRYSDMANNTEWWVISTFAFRKLGFCSNVCKALCSWYCLVLQGTGIRWWSLIQNRPWFLLCFFRSVEDTSVSSFVVWNDYYNYKCTDHGSFNTSLTVLSFTSKQQQLLKGTPFLQIHFNSLIRHSSKLLRFSKSAKLNGGTKHFPQCSVAYFDPVVLKDLNSTFTYSNLAFLLARGDEVCLWFLLVFLETVLSATRRHTVN